MYGLQGRVHQNSKFHNPRVGVGEAGCHIREIVLRDIVKMRYFNNKGYRVDKLDYDEQRI